MYSVCILLVSQETLLNYSCFANIELSEEESTRGSGMYFIEELETHLIVISSTKE